MVSVDTPPPANRVGHSFEDLHASIERSCIKENSLERRVMDLTDKNKKLKLQLKRGMS